MLLSLHQISECPHCDYLADNVSLCVFRKLCLPSLKSGSLRVRGLMLIHFTGLQDEGAQSISLIRAVNMGGELQGKKIQPPIKTS